MKREDGFYWVKTCNEWVVARWIELKWYLPGCDGGFEDEEMDEINEEMLI